MPRARSAIAIGIVAQQVSVRRHELNIDGAVRAGAGIVGQPTFQVVVLSGPSGSGKTTIVERVIAESPIRLVKSVSATTRAPRPGEVDGEAYYFLTADEFERRRVNGDFLEVAEVFNAGYWYGTLRSEVERARQLGGWSFLEIDVQGALNVMAIYPEAITIFVNPPSRAVLEQRLRERGTETPETIARRLKKVEDEVQLAGRYKFQVVNDDLEAAVKQILGILVDHSGQQQSAQAPTR